LSRSYKNMKNIIILTLILMFQSACNKNNNGKLEQRIASRIAGVCGKQDCSIDLSKITWFKWTKFYVFKETATLATIETAIQQKYPYFTDIARRLIFLDENNTIVYHEDIFPNVEGVSNRDVIFDIEDTADYKVYTNVSFSVNIRKTDKFFYYLLDQ